jgi:hypothetical protein
MSTEDLARFVAFSTILPSTVVASVMCNTKDLTTQTIGALVFAMPFVALVTGEILWTVPNLGLLSFIFLSE